MPISQNALNALTAVGFADAGSIDDYFQKTKQKSFIAWFNAALAGQGPWAQVTKLVDTRDNDIGFHRFWNQGPLVFGARPNLVQFTALMSILANEVKANFTPVPERLGRPGHKGLAYCFDKIDGVKKSYNTLPGNSTAFDCFQNPLYVSAHGQLPLGAQLSSTTDVRWKGEAYPAGIATDADPNVTGFVMQADFMKFRGRGFIQTTGRDNYVKLVEFIQKYQGGNSTLDFFAHKWTGKVPADVCFTTTNQDWDTLFGQSDLILAAEAIRIHNDNAGNYLALSPDAAVLCGTGPGSLYLMGKKISGADAYAAKFRDRALAVLAVV